MVKTVLKVGGVTVGIVALMFVADGYSRKLKCRERDDKINDALDEEVFRKLEEQKDWLENGFIDIEEYHKECNRIIGKAIRKHKKIF